MKRLIAHPATLPAAAAVLVIAIIATAMAFAGIYQSRISLVTHTFEVERELARLVGTMQEGELAARGYVRTLDQQFRTQFNAVRLQAAPQVDAIELLTSDNPNQSQHLPQLRELVQQKFDDADQAMNQRDAGLESRAIETFVSGRSHDLMDQLRALVGDMEAREEALMNERAEEANTTGVISVSLGILAALAALSVLGAWLVDRTRTTMALRETLAEQEATLASLRQSQEVAAREASARARAESQLRQVHKLEAVGQLTGGIAHDFNNMLAVVMSSITLSKRRLDKGDTNIGPILDAAMDASGRAAKLTARLLAFSRQQPLSPEPLDANRFMTNVSELLQRTLGENIKIETVLGAGLWRLHADASELENAILNLAVNARDAMDMGGKLTLETANVALDDAYASSHVDVTPGQYVMIAVSNSGEGMTPEVVEKAFDPFFTTKPVGAGTGLGLSQVLGFVKQSGGHVKIYSELGSGTTVKIYMPRYFGSQAEGPKPATAALVAPPQVQSGVILVVEDEHRLREVTCSGLRELGYTVFEAPNGHEALKLLDATPTIICLFTDIVMPDMTGRQLSEEAVKRRPDLKVLYTTGYTRNAVVHNGVLDPGVNFLPKPFTLDQLAVKLSQVLA
ncbi:MAG: CHASE3 domain-containing protein [Hyphomonadaceae bacterium]